MPDETIRCKSCYSENLGKFNAEVGIHFCGLKNIDKPTIFVSPELVVCLDCGIAQFAVPETGLRLLQKGNAASVK